jgi:hypothetical protein
MKKRTSFYGIISATLSGVGLIGACCTKLFGSSPIIVYPTPDEGSGSEGTCPGSYAGTVSYTQPLPTWGWSPATNTTTYTAVNGGGRTDIRIRFVGEYGDTGCSFTNVTVPNPPASPSYIFAIYFENAAPTTNYPIILSGFNTNN